MLLLLDDLYHSEKEGDGPVVVAHSTLLQAALHPTNKEGVTSNDGVPASRRIQGMQLTSMAQNTANMEKVLELFDIDVPQSV